MKLNKEVAIKHIEKIKDIEEKDRLAVLAINEDETISIREKKDRIEHSLMDKEFYIKYENKKVFDMLRSSENEGCIQIIAELNINVYTQKDHNILKDFLKSKGFESNEFKFEENVPAFKSIIGSDTKEGLKSLVNEISELCGENNIFFEARKTDYNDGADNVKVVNGINKIIDFMTRLDSPIIIGSKVGDILNFNVHNYNFNISDKYEASNFISFDKDDNTFKNSKSDVLKFILDKVVNNVEEDYKAHMLERNLSIVKNGFINSQKDIQNINNEIVEFKPEIHSVQNPKLSKLRTYQLELKRIDSIYTETFIQNAQKLDLKSRNTKKKRLAKNN